MTCSVCEHIAATDWTGLPSGQSHCRKCCAIWRGTRAAHCPMCCLTFTSDTACQRHKRTVGGHLICDHPSTVVAVDESTGQETPVFALSDAFGGPQWRLAREED